ncbi:hypothetical protein N7495_002026 [Penicillium taxi]|uniref:uncharacterized protein n=1 Tax=Penicillium taxi TaxID=168475 RepID=UPI002545AC27|nr:uncharacterized protein N7495_002026 [Penicillium taxi]KAJ5901498.1 hypothetical protein N7495_002026 [Penicillium taxi]
MTETPDLSKSHKRKRDGGNDGIHVTTPTPTKKHKKRENLSAASPADRRSEKHKKSPMRLKDALQDEDSEEIREKFAVATKCSKTPASDSLDLDNSAGNKSKDGKRKRSDKLHKKNENSPVIKDAEESSEQDHPATKHKHASILSKFERTKVAASTKSKKKKPSMDESPQVIVEPVFAKGLEPLPQPENPPELEQAPTYSSLPSWLANPLREPATKRAKFDTLGIKPDLLRTLQKSGYTEAFAVQSTVIPLLLNGKNNHPGDICVSAATGSGKTLSYVLPMVSSLEPRPASRLRALIVVPTRELVKQAREACELCAKGSGLHIGGAVGNVAIKEEQKLLMRMDQVYSPLTTKRQQIGLQGNDWMDFSLEDCVRQATESNGFLPGYIQQPEINVDILICTPGRLVDHIRYTKGFTLKHLEWLVIDEADRLLNESFQEWVEVITGSLDEQKAPESFGQGGKLLSRLGMSIESIPPRKVILSATMTRDISKLNSLRLENPKMVIVGGENVTDPEDPMATHTDDHFTLPPTLYEHMIPVGDGFNKPLFLLHLLVSLIKIDTTAQVPQSAAVADTSDSDSTSSDESSDSDSDSDSDSELDISDSSKDESSDSEDSDSDSVSKPQSGKTVLIFTKSSESASRLCRLITLLNPALASRMGRIIKSNKSSSSRKTLAAFRQGRITIIVATDRASRGLDLPSLTHVVNYDIPTSVTTYVHRVGRTARANREGSAWTLVAHREGFWFSREITASSSGRLTRLSAIDRVQVKPELLKPLQRKYEEALYLLEDEIKGDIRPSSRTSK